MQSHSAQLCLAGGEDEHPLCDRHHGCHCSLRKNRVSFAYGHREGGIVELESQSEGVAGLGVTPRQVSEPVSLIALLANRGCSL